MSLLRYFFLNVKGFYLFWNDLRFPSFKFYQFILRFLYIIGPLMQKEPIYSIRQHCQIYTQANSTINAVPRSTHEIFGVRMWDRYWSVIISVSKVSWVEPPSRIFLLHGFMHTEHNRVFAQGYVLPWNLLFLYANKEGRILSSSLVNIK